MRDHLTKRWVETNRGLPPYYICGPRGLAATVGDAECCGHSNMSHVYTDCPACEMEVATRSIPIDRVLQVARMGPNDRLIIGLSTADYRPDAEEVQALQEEVRQHLGHDRVTVIYAPGLTLTVEEDV